MGFVEALGDFGTRLGWTQLLRFVMNPVLVWCLFCAVFIFWHVSGPYQAALRHESLHALEHVTLLAVALAFWSIVIEPSGQRRIGYGVTLLFVATATILSGLPGALMILAPRPLYPIHKQGAAAFHLSPMEDQQLAGLIMWVFAGFFYFCVIAWLFMKWLGEADHLDHAPRIIRICPPLVAALALMLGGCEAEPQSQTRVAKAYGDPTRGAALIVREGCGGCHVIPGIGNAEGVVGPSLAMIGRRVFIAGLLRNSPDAMILWLQHPQSVIPGNAMPDMNLSESDARDIAAYLMTLQ